MGFASPLWFLGLLPIVVAIWFVRRGDGGRVVVPATRFWKGLSTESGGTTDRRPPWRAIWLLLAAAFAIIAAAGPELRATADKPSRPPTSPSRDVAIVSAFGGDDGLRLIIDAQLAEPTSVQVAPDGVTQTLTVPQGLSHHLLPATSGSTVRLQIEDDRPENDIADVTRENRPTVVSSGDLPRPLIRLVDAINGGSKSQSGKGLTILPTSETLFGPGISVASSVEEAVLPIDVGDFEPAFGVRWERLNDLGLASDPPPDGDEVVVTDATGRPMVTVDREGRQVWVGFWSDELTKTGDFVRFWADTIAWVDEEPLETPVARRQPDLAFDADASAELFRSSLVRTDARPVAVVLALVATLLAGATGARRGV
ncbi:MAG: BatA domain-containing protein [Planctomycetota bacterium]